MADNFLFLIAAMDRLWFHQTILFIPEPFSLYSPKTLKEKLPNSESAIEIPSSSSSLSLSSLAEETSTAVCPLHDQLDDSKTEEEEVKKRPTRVSHSFCRSRSHSSSSPSSTEKREKNHRHSTTSCSILGSKVKLGKSINCRSLKDLELEEVKGFMDLGFIFKKEHLNARMISVVPGLLRLGYLEKPKRKMELNLAADDAHEPPNKDDDDIEREDERRVIRPYLSEAWVIKRPDSPLMNLRVPRVTAAADMKKHLKFWARTVASVIQQES